jgi:hypothetical protein
MRGNFATAWEGAIKEHRSILSALNTLSISAQMSLFSDSPEIVETAQLSNAPDKTVKAAPVRNSVVAIARPCTHDKAGNNSYASHTSSTE